MKGRLVKDSLMFGIFGTLAASSLGGLHNGADYALGGLCASVYVVLAIASFHLISIVITEKYYRCSNCVLD